MQPLDELFSGIWLAEDDGPVHASRQDAVDGAADRHTAAAVPERHSVLDQLAALPDAADVPGGVSVSVDDGEHASHRRIVSATVATSTRRLATGSRSMLAMAQSWMRAPARMPCK